MAIHHFNRGWHHRGALPHFDSAGVTSIITYRLADSLPIHVLQRLRADPDLGDAQRRRRIETLLDDGHGSCRLGDPRAA